MAYSNTSAEILTAIPLHTLPDAKTFADEYGGTNGILTQVGETLSNLENDKRSSAATFIKNLDILYTAWALSTRPELAAVGEKITRGEDLEQTYPGALKTLIERGLKYYDADIFRPRALIRLSTDPSRPSTAQEHGMYSEKGTKWFPIPTANSRTAIFARRDVVEEAYQLELQLGRTEPSLFHDTSSCALNGIVSGRSILSSSKAQERGHPIKSGEYLTLDRHDERLDYVYAKNSLDGGYSTVRWFDEHPVAFEAPTAAIEQYVAEQHGVRRRYHGLSANGHEIPEELPLEYISAVYAPRHHINEALREQLATTAPVVPLISLEAGQLLRNYVQSASAQYPDYLYRQDQPLLPDMGAVLSQTAITLG